MADETPQDDGLSAEIDADAAAVEATLGDDPGTDGPDGAAEASPGESTDESTDESAGESADPAVSGAPAAEEESDAPGLGARIVEFARTKPRMAGAIVVAFILLVIVMRLTACAPPPPAHSFWTVAAPEYAELAASARATAMAIAKTSTAADLKEVKAVAVDQLDVVEGVAETIDETHFSDGEIPMRNAMIEAVAAQRDFLAHLVRTAKRSPAAAAAQVPALAESAEAMNAEWETFLEMVHQAPPSIVHTGMVEKVEEMRGALRTPTPPDSAPAKEGAAVTSPKGKSADRVYVGGDGFRVGAVACGRLMGNGVLCESANGSAVRLYPDDGAVAIDRPTDGPLKANFPRGTEWADAGGGIVCTAQGTGVRCMNPVGQGFDFAPGSFTPLSRANS